MFYVDKYDPRMPHPRKIFSRNYHHIVASKLFPKENLVASCKRLPNLGEISSPTNQNTTPNGGGNNSQVFDGGRLEWWEGWDNRVAIFTLRGSAVEEHVMSVHTFCGEISVLQAWT